MIQLESHWSFWYHSSKNRNWDRYDWFADISKAKRNIGYRPEYSINQGIKKTVSWFKEEFK